MAASHLLPTSAATALWTEPFPFVDDGEALDPSWIGRLTGLGDAVASARLEEVHGAGGLTGRMRRATVLDGEGRALTTLVLKTTREACAEGLRRLGLCREALFYQRIAPHIAPHVGLARALASHAGDGAKFILMEDLGSCVQSGKLFGPGSPLNDGQDLTAAVRSAGGVCAQRVAAAAFLAAARFHAAHWGDGELVGLPWLRGAEWPRGGGREEWEASQAVARSMWARSREAVAAGEQAWWDARAVALIEASLGKARWVDHVARFQQRPWTLVHGDYHPANMMWRPPAEGAAPPKPWEEAESAEETRAEADRLTPQLVLLDFEVVGLGSGPQDLAQYLISHAEPSVRRSCERRLLAMYREELVRGGVKEAPSAEEMEREYAEGGAERWVWLLAYMAGCCPEGIVRYLHNQFLAFAVDHGITPERVGQPRV